MNFEKELTSACKRVFEQLGFGLAETVYEKALMYELRTHKHTVDNQVYIELLYTDSKGEKHHVSNLILDLVVKDINTVIELKTIKGSLKQDSKEYYQVKRYQRNEGFERAYLINFSPCGPEIYDCSSGFIRI